MIKITDDFVRQNNARILACIPLLRPHEPQKTQEPNDSQDEKGKLVTTEEKAFLWDIYNRPYLPTTERYDTVHIKGRKFSTSKGTKIVKKLERNLVVMAHPINLGGRGGSAKFLELTEKGFAAIDMKPKPGIGRGAGYEHGFWQYQIRENLRNVEGIQKAGIEGSLGNKCIDVLVETKELRMIAIEIAMTDAHEKENIEKDIEAGAARVFEACRDKSVFENVAKILEELSEDTRSKVKLCLVHQLVGEVEAFLIKSRSNEPT